ncbi:hypothetical protein E4K66_21405 [Bradyrhizobium frederickii]|uniref:Uncharacterized protein n=1 Tax=Bradyrhizobium frederickii TaxID=2560054 RepID=A0A4Y9L1H0_9BRAD|nr:hypothetical protein E4K66_21405 [Bradyrhizobium frederickii]
MGDNLVPIGLSRGFKASLQSRSRFAALMLWARRRSVARMDAEKGVRLLNSMSFPDVSLRVYRRGCDRRRPVRNCAALM